MFLKKYIWLSAATLLTACDLIDYHPYDGRLDSDTSREINPTNIERIEKVCEGKDTIRFIFMGDTQRSYNETEDHYPWRRLYGVRLKEGIRVER